MPINPDAVGAESDPVERSWTSKDALLYAVGVGAGTDELPYTTENSKGIAQQVLPIRRDTPDQRCVDRNQSSSDGPGVSGLFPDRDDPIVRHAHRRLVVHKPVEPLAARRRLPGQGRLCDERDRDDANVSRV